MKLKNFRHYLVALSLLGGTIGAAPLAAMDCGCSGKCDYNCECGADCACTPSTNAVKNPQQRSGCSSNYANNCYSSPVVSPEKAECCEEDSSCFCIKGFTAGIEYLYWKPCISGLHYAVKGENSLTSSTNKLKYSYVSPSAESGFRIFNTIETSVEGLYIKATYTDLGCESTNCVASQTANAVQLSRGQPIDRLLTNGAKGLWEMKYQTVEVVAGYHNTMDCVKINAYGGVDVLMLDQKLNGESTDTLTEATRSIAIKQRQQYFGAGPILGVGASFELSNCLSFFLDTNVSLLMGCADEHDKFFYEEDSTREVDRRFKSEDCFCFPGWHLQFGLSYESSYCGWNYGVRFGYDILQYINGPFFLDYEQDEYGILSGSNSNNLLLRGLFVGTFIGF